MQCSGFAILENVGRGGAGCGVNGDVAGTGVNGNVGGGAVVAMVLVLVVVVLGNAVASCPK